MHSFLEDEILLASDKIKVLNVHLYICFGFYQGKNFILCYKRSTKEIRKVKG